jgi:TPP-dependent trihydroxycyclohexane-1,2-dione (THcHDO) dehydratase
MGKSEPIQTLSFDMKPYIENQYFEYKNIVFALLHVPGSNNNLYDGSQNAECPSSLQLIDFDCVAATAECKARDVAITQSLQKVFAVAKSNQNSGIFIMIQADFVNVDNAACNTLNITISNVVTKIATGYRNFCHNVNNGNDELNR